MTLEMGLYTIHAKYKKSVVEKKIADVNDLNHLTFKRKQTDKIRNIYMKELLSSKVKSAVEKKNVSDLKHITLDRKQFDKIRNIHRNWYLFSIKALLSQMAKELLTTAPGDCAKELKECLKQIKYSKDITETARCLTKAKESQEELTLTTRFETSTKKRTMRFWLKNVTRLDFERLKEALRPSRISKSVIKRRKRLRRSPHRLFISHVHKSDRDFFEIKSQHVAPTLLEPSTSSPVRRLSDLFISLFTDVSPSTTPTRWSTTYGKMLELNQKLEENKNLPGAQVYNRRIYDIVMDTKEDEKDSHEPILPDFLKNIVDVVKSFNKAGSSRILSPRLIPLLPDKASYSGFLSPALFPLYKDEAEPQILPIPKMLEDSGLNASDRERVLQMIMELSGARETVDNAMKVLDNLNALGVGDELLRVSDEISNSFERLRSSFSNDQSDELKQRGFTFMKVDQMKKLHKEQGLREPKVDAQTEEYGRLFKNEREKALWETIAELAGLRVGAQNQ
ncbi:hypothetical protein KIN20_030593 [Parelaphostrongylus tenuis]|uniref:Uncharacterized protein n=1 Tax=Parelaphostrongylus tenuis TaxID=148309 RepID=A0AAD5WGF2_PARTN|nr:hypothetical protein KIN20_030593 [Parelaphostrongylus tenuis]